MNVVKADAKAVFLEALDCDGAEELLRFLEQACGSNVPLRTRVEELLQAHRDAGGFLGGTEPLGTSCDPPGAERPGTVIGPYTLLQQIGEGGMGTVFMAEQTQPVQRKVALKLIKAGTNSRQVVARFKAEGQTLALMDHTNIARVLDAGVTEAGRPYFVMELVHGVPITKYCDDSRLTPAERLELFVPVCQAIQHAHQKGIIHRDIKPSNVMITLSDGKPVPKVIDFGVAKATEQKRTELSLSTQYGTMVGTLEYMSPEQAEMSTRGVDTRGDIYSLGVLLYELLTGGTPLSRGQFKDASYGEVLRIIREEEAPKPSLRLSESGPALASISAQRRMEPAALTKLVRGELDWIVMKALEKDRDRRYDTANDFAADVQRYLNDEPVLAFPPSAGYRLRKFARRHQAAVVAVGLVCFTLVAGIVGTTLGLVQAKHAEAVVVGERSEKLTALDNLVAEQKKTQTALDAQTRAREQTYSALRTLTDDVITDVLTRQPKLGEAEQAFLRKVLRFYDQLAREYGDTSMAWAIRGDGQWLVGRIHDVLGESKEAETAYRDARAARLRVLADSPNDPKVRRSIVACEEQLGALLAKLDRNPEAEAMYREAIATCAQLIADFPLDLESAALLAHCQAGLGSWLAKMGKLPEAEAAYREALAVGPKSADDSLADPKPRHSRAITQELLANLLSQTGRSKEAEALYQEALAVRVQLVADFPGNALFRYEVAGSRLNLGTVFVESGRNPQAEAAFRECIALLRKLISDSPAVPRYRDKLADGLANLGTLLTQTGRAKQAEEIQRESLAIRSQLAADYPDVADYRRARGVAHVNLGNVFAETGRPKEAEVEYREAIKLQTKLTATLTDTPEVRRELSRSHSCLGIVLSELGRKEDAETAYREAVALDSRLVEEFPALSEYAVAVAGTCCNLGNLYQSTDRAAEAIAWYDRGIAALGPVVTKEPQRVKTRMFLRNCHAGRAGTLAKLGRHAEALKDWDRAVELSPSSQKPLVQIDRALCLARAGDSVRAVQAVETVLAAPKVPGGCLYDAACVLALSAAAVKDDDVLREKYGARAVEVLALARAADYFRQPGNVEQLKKDTDLDALRDRAEFKKLLAELEVGKSKDKK